MKKRMQLNFMAIAMISMIAVLLLTTVVFYNLFQNEVIENLHTCADMLGEDLVNYKDTNRIISQKKVDNIRVTLIDKDGVVLADSDVNADVLENHKERPEVKEAIEKGSGKSIRTSNTLSHASYYYAIRLSDGNILRLAKESQSFFSFLIRVSPFIGGIAILLFVVSIFLSRLFFNGATTTEPVPNKLPKIFGESGLSGTIFSSLNIEVTVLIALVLVILVWFVLYKTKWGLRIRSIGEHPAAADTLGISVSKTRYICTILSGIFAGFGGASMTLAVVSQFSPTAISGQGFIALAAVIFGKWTPFGAYGACLLFGFAQALVVVLGGGNIVIPSEILAMLPYVLTILVLILFVGKSVAPKADGVPYEKGSR